MKVLVKVGGKVIDKKEGFEKFCRGVKKLFKDKNKIVIVHGGGRQLTKWMSELDIETRFVDGLRYTDGKTLEVVVSILCGLINKELVLGLQRFGVPAVGLSGIDAKTLPMKRKRKLGFVGDEVVRVDAGLIERTLKMGYVVVVSPVGLASEGGRLIPVNVNADTACVALAEKLSVDVLVFITDTKGVLDKNGKVIKKLEVSRIEGLIEDGVVTEGMVPKLRSIGRLVRSGVRRVVITDKLGRTGTEVVA